MKNIIKSQKGSLGIALVVALLAILSGASLSLVAFRDLHSMRLQLDQTQQFHLLRSEVGRGRLVASVYEGMEYPPPVTSLPMRYINIDFGTHRTQFRTLTKISTTDDFASIGFLIRTLITATRGSGTLVSEQMRRSEEHTSELQSRPHLVCRLLLEKKKKNKSIQSEEAQALIERHTKRN